MIFTGSAPLPAGTVAGERLVTPNCGGSAPTPVKLLRKTKIPNWGSDARALAPPTEQIGALHAFNGGDGAEKLLRIEIESLDYGVVKRADRCASGKINARRRD